jgi:site-specific DNA recombinase
MQGATKTGGGRAVSIARVSTPGQADNTSPSDQHRRNNEYAAAHGLVVVAELTEIESGALILARVYNPRSPIFQSLRMIEEGAADTVIFDVPDRIGRGDTLAVLEFMYRQAGAQVVYAQPGRERDTLQGRVMRLAEQLTSDVERNNIRRRLDGGKWAKARAGGIVAVGPAPYGYRFVREFDEMGRKRSVRLEVDTAKIGYWRMAYDWIMGGESLTGVARKLTALGIAPPGRAKNGWRTQSLVRIFRSPVYMGRWEYGKRITQTVDLASGRRSVVVGERPVSERASAVVPAVITAEQWEALQRVLDKAADRFVTGTKYEYLLRGMLTCARCGYTLTGTPTQHKGGVSLYYECRNRRHNFIDPCRGAKVNGAEAERLVWEMIEGWILEPGAVAEGAEARAEIIAQDAQGGLAAAREVVAREIDSLGRELRRVLRLYTKQGMNLSEYREMETEIRGQVDAAQRRLEELDARIAGAEMARRGVDAAGDLRATLAERLRSAGAQTFEFRRRLLEAIELWGVWDQETRVLQVYSLLGEGAVTLLPYASRKRGRPRGDTGMSNG